MASTDPKIATQAQWEDLADRVKAAKNIKELTSADYNYPDGSPDGVALWKLDEGLYFMENSVKIYLNTTESTSAGPATILITRSRTNQNSSSQIYVFYSSYITTTVTKSDGTTQGIYTTQRMLGQNDIVDNLASSSTYDPLSANQGRILSDKIVQGESFFTTETETDGKWIDGSTIYKKTISTGTLPNATIKSVVHGISNLSRVIKVEGYAYASNSTGAFHVPLPNSDISVQVVDDTIELYSATDMSWLTESYVTLYYIKSS